MNFRSISPFATTGLALLISTAALAAADFVPLFNGKTLDGWSGDARFWRAEAGAIVGETAVENPSPKENLLIWEGGDVADFELKLEFKITSGHSSILYRSVPIDEPAGSLGGYRAELSADHRWTGVASSSNGRGLMAGRGQKTVVGAQPNEIQIVASLGTDEAILAAMKPQGWNEYHIIARGNQCLHFINGVQVSEFSVNSDERLSKGKLALQLSPEEPMQVYFRKLQLRKLEPADTKQILFLAGKKSHGYGAHEHKAGCTLLARCLNESGLDVSAHVVTEGAWPEPWQGYDKPDTIVMYCDGLKRHIAKAHQDKIQALTDAGVGVACLHFGVEVEPKVLGETFLNWIGGYFEIGWSVNPHWDASFEALPEHPITNGVQPFTIRDEWYYHMRFQPDMEGVTPILSALPPLETLTSRAKDKNRGSNPAAMAAVKAGQEQHVAWAYERPNGGRGFGFTGGHFHQNWQQDDFRKLVLNALLWTAQADVPESGVASRTPSQTDLDLNQDYPEKKPK